MILKSITRLIFLMSCVSIAAFSSVPKSTEPESVATTFYSRYMTLKMMGIPGQTQRDKLADVLAPALEDALAKADAAEAHYAKETNNEVPPLLEGDAFTSLFEGATSYNVTGCAIKDDTARCAIALAYSDKVTPERTKWSDTLVLTRIPALGWRVSDIVYGGDWQFGNKGSLTKTLKDVVWEAHAVSQ